MNIQSLSLVCPTKGCINKCKFCVSRTHENNYENNFDVFQMQKRIKWAVNNGVNTCIITGTGEALQNKRFLNETQSIFKSMDFPFPNIELQTTGVLLKDEGNIILLKTLGVNTISLSVSDIYDDTVNMEIIGVAPALNFKLQELCQFIKNQGFNLRLSLNMTNIYDKIKPDKLFIRLKELNADQVTFRKLWSNGTNCEQNNWIEKNACKNKTLQKIEEYVAGELYHNNRGEVWRQNGFGKPLYKLPFGAMAYSINGMSVVLDNNCMSKDENEKLKYVILRENGKLYCQWDDYGSLIF